MKISTMEELGELLEPAFEAARDKWLETKGDGPKTFNVAIQKAREIIEAKLDPESKGEMLAHMAAGKIVDGLHEMTMHRLAGKLVENLKNAIEQGQKEDRKPEEIITGFCPRPQNN